MEIQGLVIDPDSLVIKPICITGFYNLNEICEIDESDLFEISATLSDEDKPVASKRQRKPRFQCEICEHLFPSKGHVEIHMRTHTGEKPFSCHICGKTSARLHDLKTHVLTHSKKKNFKCNYCSSEFNQKSNYTRHLKRHKEAKNLKPEKVFKKFECSICPELLPSKTALYAHNCAHFGKKPYNCEECGRGFTRQYDLKCHLRIHTGEKPYSCTICRIDFRQQSNYRRHLKMHEENHAKKEHSELEKT